MKKAITLSLLFLSFVAFAVIGPFPGTQSESSSTPSTSGITSINGNTTAAQVITSGTSGTDVAVSSSGGTTTINIPSASATARGVLTTTTQTIAGNKNFSGKILAGSTTTPTSTTAGVIGAGVTSYNGTDAGNVLTMLQNGYSGVGLMGYTDELNKSTLNNAAGHVGVGGNGVGFYTTTATAVGADRTWLTRGGFKASTGDFVFGGGYDGGASAANATDAVAPFFFINSCAGTPTGTPTTSLTGKVPLIVDTSGNKLWGYYGGAWHDLTGL